MQGEQLEEAEVTAHGILGDRAYALIDVETGKVASAKSVRLFPDLLACRATFVISPKGGCEIPPVLIDLPNGVTVATDSADADGALSEYFGRKVRLSRVAPDDFTVDQYHPDVEGVDPGGHRDAFVAQKLGAALFRAIGMESPVPAGSFLDLFPLSIMTTSTLARLNELRPETRFDQVRFRMNVILRTQQPGFVENDWVGRELRFDNGTRINVALLDPRCVMTTLAQDGLPQDINVMRTLVHHNKLQVGDLGKYPCAGVYAMIGEPGKLAIGDLVYIN